MPNLTKEARDRGRSKPLKPRDLNAKQAVFVAELLKGSTAKAAAVVAGYVSNPKDSAGRLTRTPAVRDALAAARRAAADIAKYNGSAAMGELADAAVFARETGNATALCRAYELRMKLMGLLDADKGASGGSLTFNISGVDFGGAAKVVEAAQ